MEARRLCRCVAGSLPLIVALLPCSVAESDLGATAAQADTGRPAATTCEGVAEPCVRFALGMLNRERARYDIAPLRLLRAQSEGAGVCAGSYGHSVAMAQSRTIWHVNPRYPRASFPTDICRSYSSAGENVGEAPSGGVLPALRELNAMMMREPHDAATCAVSLDSHACNILNPAYHFLGIGILYSRGATWLTEDFTN